MSEQPRTPPAPEPPTGPAVILSAEVSGGGDANLAGRDQHFYYVPGRRRTRPSADAVEAPCPYPGLEPFALEQEQWFHGRDEVIALVCRRLDLRLSDALPLMLVGASGSGKTSLLRAGVLPALAQGALPAADSHLWPQVVLTPSASPLKALTAFAGLGPVTAGEQAEGIAGSRPDPDVCAAAVLRSAGIETGTGTGAAERENPGLVLVVDQFEETFTLCADEAERGWFVDVLEQIAQAGAGRVSMLLSVRADFYGRCAEYPFLRQALRTGPVLLDPLTEDQLKDAIRLPALAVGLVVEDGLVELLLNELGAPRGLSAGGERPGASWTGRLPFLAHALRATWQRRHGHILTVQAYREVGGIRDSIAERAEAVYDALSERDREASRLLFLRLVNVGLENDDTARKAGYEELLDELPDPVAAAAAVEAFTRSRLLIRDRETVTVVHEALFGAWPRLWEWIDQDRAGSILRQGLEENAAAWDRSGRDPVSLIRGSRLVAARTWAQAHPREMSPAASEFLRAAGKLEHRGRRVRRAVVATIGVLALLACSTAAIAFEQAAQAHAEATTAIGDQVAEEAAGYANSNPTLSAQLALVAYRMNPTQDNASGLFNTENETFDTRVADSSEIVDSVAYSPDGRVLAVGAADGLIRLWSLSAAGPPVPLGQPLNGVTVTGGIDGLAFSPDGHYLATGADSGTVEVWNIASTAAPSIAGDFITPSAGTVRSLAFSPDGRTLAVAGDAAGGQTGSLTLLSVARSGGLTMTGSQTLPIADPSSQAATTLDSVAFSPGGQLIAAGSTNGSVHFWNVRDPSSPQALSAVQDTPDHMVTSIAFTPDGQVLAVGSNDDDVRLWDTSDLSDPTALGGPLPGPASPVQSVAFSSDGQVLAAGHSDGSVSLWNTAAPGTPSALGPDLVGTTDAVTAVAFSPRGDTLAAADFGGGVDLWSLPPTVLGGTSGDVGAVAFSPNGKILAIGGGDGAVSLWDTTDPGDPRPLGRPLPNPGGAVAALAFSPDGGTLSVSTTQGGTFSLWDVTDPANATILSTTPVLADREVSTMAFSPRGHLLATGSAAGSIQFWNVADPRLPSVQGQPLAASGGEIDSVAFSPDGGSLAVGTFEFVGGTSVSLWNVTDPDTPAELAELATGSTNITNTVTFSPDGHILAAGSGDGDIRLWNVANPGAPTALGQPLTAAASTSGPVFSLAFSPDGHTLASGDQDSTVSLWDVADPAHPVSIGQPLTGPTQAVDSVAFGSGTGTGLVLAGGSDDGTVRLWNLDTAYASQRICDATAATMTEQEWNLAIPELPYNPPCT